MTYSKYYKIVLEAVTQGSKVDGYPSRILFHSVKTILLSLSLCLGGCAGFVQLGDSKNSFDRDSAPYWEEGRVYGGTLKNQSHSEWSDRQPQGIQNTYIGSGVNPNGGQNETGTQFPFGRTGWGTRPYEHNF